ARVALVERSLLGGECLTAGCVPSKALVRAARAAAAVHDADRFGVRIPADSTVDFTAVMARMRNTRARLATNDSAARFRGLGVDVYFGAARFMTSDTMEVEGRSLRFHRALIATGSRPVVPSIPGLTEAGCRTTDTVFALT